MRPGPQHGRHIWRRSCHLGIMLAPREYAGQHHAAAALKGHRSSAVDAWQHAERCETTPASKCRNVGLRGIPGEH
jgi:hypothetical protein